MVEPESKAGAELKSKKPAYVSVQKIMASYSSLVGTHKRAFITSHNNAIVEGYLKDRAHISGLLGGEGEYKNEEKLVEFRLKEVVEDSPDSLITTNDFDGVIGEIGNLLQHDGNIGVNTGTLVQML